MGFTKFYIMHTSGYFRSHL